MELDFLVVVFKLILFNIERSLTGYMGSSNKNNLEPNNKSATKFVTIKYCISFVLISVVIALALILIVSSFYRKEDIAKEEYIFEYGEDALAKLKADINADDIQVNFQSENNMGYPKCGKYTGTAIKKGHTETFTVVIKDTVPPEFTSSVETLEYNAGEGSSESVLSNFTAYDLSEVVELNIQGNIDYKTAGTYNITVSATDNSRNTSTVDCVVVIKGKDIDSGSDTAYSNLKDLADSNSEDFVQYTDERPVNKESHLSIDVVGIDLDIEEEDLSGEYFSREFEEEDVCIFTSGLSEPGKGGSVLIGGSSSGSFKGLSSVNVGNDITVYWDGVEYHYKVSISEECKVDTNSLISLSTNKDIMTTTDNNVLQLYSDYGKQTENSVWFVRAELVN